MATIAPFVPRRRLPVTVGENLRERLITTTFINEGLKDICTRSWEDFDYPLPGCKSSRMATGRDLSVPGQPEDRNQFARQGDRATAGA
jgi:hypothetical protein